MRSRSRGEHVNARSGCDVETSKPESISVTVLESIRDSYLRTNAPSAKTDLGVEPAMPRHDDFVYPRDENYPSVFMTGGWLVVTDRRLVATEIVLSGAAVINIAKT